MPIESDTALNPMTEGYAVSAKIVQLIADGYLAKITKSRGLVVNLVWRSFADIATVVCLRGIS